MLKKYKIILLLVLIILLISVSTKVSAATKIYRVNWESIVVDENNKNIKYVLPVNTRVEYIRTSAKDKNFYEIRYYVQKDGYRQQSFTGYIRKNVLKTTTENSASVIKVTDKSSKIMNNKIKIVNLARTIKDKNIGYNQNQRVNFYRNYTTTKATDCSSLCSTIYNRVLGFNMYRDNAKTNVWLATDFVKNANNTLYKVDNGKKVSKAFNFVKNITNGQGKLSNTNMQIGDCIVIGKKYNDSYDHIAMYVGNGQIIEAIYSDGGNNTIYSKVIVRFMPTYYYNAANGNGAGQWYKIAQIRPFSKYMADGIK